MSAPARGGASPPGAGSPRGAGHPADDPRPPLPPLAGAIGLAGLLVGNVAAVVGYAVGVAITPHELFTALLLSELLLWGGMLGACWYASRMFATGSFRVDFSVRPKRSDVALGVLFALADWAAANAVTQLVSLLGRSYAGDNSGIVTDVRDDVPALGLTVAFALLGAPIVEELFFRGLMQRSIQAWAGVPGAIAVQGLLFGAVHLGEDSGAGLLGLWLSLSAVGIVHGIVYQRYKRITTSMWTHVMFNVGGVVLIFLTL